MVIPLPPPPIPELAMERRRTLCNAHSTLNNSYPGQSIKMLLVPLQMAYVFTATRLLMRWTLAISIHMKHLELMHRNLSGFNTAKLQPVSYLHSLLSIYLIMIKLY